MSAVLARPRLAAVAGVTLGERWGWGCKFMQIYARPEFQKKFLVRFGAVYCGLVRFGAGRS